ncbi:MAG TPA: efflux RND transporter periplasmic adaptor subunit [Vicinamibacterales bacterium]|nr:efflux RND transporter periplasmic adaptor subunit [Vicinamibacterales bacterium]
MPPARVELTTVNLKPVDRTTEYVATLRSRRSSEIRPQVDGIVTRIHVRSGSRVSAGTPLMQIDAGKQQATVSSNEASRLAQEATLRYAREEYERARGLFKEGLLSKQELDQAATAVATAEAALKALEARERESRVELAYYTVAAPTAGVVGDIPVRVGDRVTTSTVLTTIDQQAGLEAYIYVPIERASQLRLGLPVRLLSDDGQVVATTAIDFVSPQVDERTQSVLVKGPVPSGRGFRTEQFVRAQIVWSSEPALTIPALAVTRVNGQYFLFVAEQQDKGLVARQRLVRLGPLIGNEYVVLDGLEPGDRVVTAGVQRLGDGLPIAPEGQTS